MGCVGGTRGRRDGKTEAKESKINGEPRLKVPDGNSVVYIRQESKYGIAMFGPHTPNRMKVYLEIISIHCC